MARAPIDDDRPIGRILTRREVLALFGGSALVAACAPAAVSSPAVATSAAAATVLPSCVVRPALTEGPYFVDEKLNRSDIRSDPSTNAMKPGTPLVLTFLVSKVSGSACTALANATVDVWHCDALGVYSDASDPNFGSTKGSKFLRGFQITDPNGSAKFTTVWPGWYQGRAVHIHFKIRTTATNGQIADFTSQLFFPDAMNDTVFANSPYSQKGTKGILRNDGDDIFKQSGGKLTLSPAKAPDGYAVRFDIGLAG
jgi:protocatechuate 3,4-dioxygenase beta subunit